MVVRLEPQPGSRCVVDRLGVQLVDIEKDRRYPGWVVRLRTEATDREMSWTLVAETKDRLAIEFVDERGRPRSPRAYSDELKRRPKNPRIRSVTMHAYRKSDPQDLFVQLPIDPSMIGGFGISATYGEWHETGTFVLDPEATR